MIEAIHLTKRYGTFHALHDANFTINEGEVVGFLGPNGAGKSTTMNLLCGYLTPTEGQVLIEGTDMALDPLAAKKQIGYLPEIPPLYMDMTVAEQLGFVAELRGLRYGKARMRAYIGELCARTKITETMDRLIRNLSKGYRQRVGVTQLLVGNPKILILDEPTVGLDPRQIREFRDLLYDLSKDHTIILSSHILSEISSLCDRILVFSEGKLIADGNPDELQEQLSGCRKLEAEITGDVNSIRNLIALIPDVLSVENIHDDYFRILHKPGTDIRRSLYQALRDSNHELLMMKPEELSLESLYLRITEREQEKTGS